MARGKHLVVFVVAACGVLGGVLPLAAGCGDDGAAEGDGGADALVEGAATDPALCPPELPDAGESCRLPEGTTCVLGACGRSVYRCTRGVWQIAANPPERPPCPELPPDNNAACPECFVDFATCTYGADDCSRDASANATVATCVRGSWRVTVEACGGADGGARDAAPGDASDDDASDDDAGDAAAEPPP